MKKLSPDITDEELNEAFREAAVAWPAAASSAQKDAGWEKMQAKLAALRGGDPSLSRTDSIRRRSKLVMVLLLWAMMVTCWMMQPGAKKTAQENKISGAADKIKSADTIIAEKQSSRTGPGPAGLHQQMRSKNNEISSRKEPALPGVAAEPDNSRQDAAENAHRIAEQDDAENLQEQAGSVAAENERQHAEEFAVPGDSGAAAENSMDTRKDSAVQKEIAGNNARQVKIKEKPAAQPEDKEEKQKNKSRFPRWAVGLTTGPDWSMVAGKSQTRPGLDKGITIQYRISRKWSLETGILLASKIYSARPEDYHSVNPYPNATGINASCQVIDLPLNIRYNVWQPKKEQLFVVAGLSSFWMQKESYLFTYNANGASSTSETNIYHQNRHLLSIVNMALGYEHTWGKISIGASPYIKIPLAGIGYGRVKLFSTGILASVKYNF